MAGHIPRSTTMTRAIELGMSRITSCCESAFLALLNEVFFEQLMDFAELLVHIEMCTAGHAMLLQEVGESAIGSKSP